MAVGFDLFCVTNLMSMYKAYQDKFLVIMMQDI